MKKLMLVVIVTVFIINIWGQEIFIDEIPDYMSFSNLLGHVEGIEFPEAYHVYVFIYVEGWWWPKPYAISFCAINADFEWECDVTTGGIDNHATRFFSMLVPEDEIPLQSNEQYGEWEEFLPDSYSNYPYDVETRLPGTREINFSGYSWICKKSTAGIGPNNNIFSDDEDKVFVDENGDLHLTISNSEEVWKCTEVVSEVVFGYGTYIFSLGYGLPDFPLDAVLGIFTWYDDVFFDPYIDNIYKEIDIEYSNWNNASNPFSQYVVQPYDETEDNIHRFNYYPSEGVSCAYEWEESSLYFVTYYGDSTNYPPSSEDIIEEWNYIGDDIPAAGNTRQRFNLWLTGNDNIIEQDLEIIITNFSQSNNTPISIPLFVGWNWFSLNVEADDMDINSVLASVADNASNIKNQTQNALYYEGMGWFGSLSELNTTTFYKMEVVNTSNLIFAGMPVNISEQIYNLSTGWNWISYAPQVSEEINYALSSIQHGSNIKSQTVNALYYEGMGWFGSLTTLDPLAGYMLEMVEAEQLVYPEPEMIARSSDSINFFAVDAAGWFVNPYEYEFNNVLNARIISESRIDPADYELAVFCGDECRGIAEVLDYTEPFGGIFHSMMVYSDQTDSEEMHFMLYDRQNDQIINPGISIVCQADMTTGDFIDPVLIMLPNHESDSILSSRLLSCYPNPFNPETNISFELAEDEQVKIEVYNIKGQKIATVLDQQMTSGSHTLIWNAQDQNSGIFFLRFSAGDECDVKKVILLK